MSKYMNLDSAQSVFFDRQLEQIKAQVYGIKYPAYKARQFIPVNSEGDGASIITYQMEDIHGQGPKIISDYAADLPTSEASGQEFSVRVRDLGRSVQWTVAEIRAGARLGKDLPSKKMEAARKLMERDLDVIAQLGDATTGLKGFLNHSAVDDDTVDNGASTAPEWETKTADEIITDLTEAQQFVISSTLGVYKPNMLLVPETSYATLLTKRLPDTSANLMSYIMANFGLQVEPWYALETAGDSSSKRFVMYYKDPEVLTLEIPSELVWLDPQPKNLSYVVPGYMSTAGVVMYQPKAVVYRDHI